MKNILIIDDSRAVHAYVTTCFQPFEVKITHVYNGQEALDLLERTDEEFNLILLDWEMPILDGPSTFDSLKSQGLGPVIMMTTKNSPDDISMMLGKGVNEYILKPFTSDILVEKVEMVLGEGLSNVSK